jgi:hypothetical protein
VERELQERLAADESGSPLAEVAIVCLACRGVCSSDAHFCKYCGARFNVLVVAHRGPAGGSK